ncbi:MAG: ABC transporter ATP-binding protein [Flavobacteriales bacterium]
MPVNNPPLLQVDDLNVEFPSADGRITAVNGVSFQINPGEIVALVGESGSGKSVTALSIMQLLKRGGGAITEGNITLYSGREPLTITAASDHVMTLIRGKEIGMIFQEPMSALNPAMTCGRQITEVVYKHLNLSANESFDRCINLLEEVGIPDPVEALLKYPHQFSGGQKQRILLAMALAGNPRLLIADEPTTALDASVKRKINQLIHDVKAKHDLSVLYISHDIESLKGFADRILVMYAGKLIEEGKTDQILNNPKHPYTRGLLACRPPKSGHYYFLPTTDDFMRISLDGKDVQQTGSIDEVFRKLEVSEGTRNANLKKMYASEPILKVCSISKSFVKADSKTNKQFAVENVSFNLFEGETLGLVGASGSGKTTLGRCIVGLSQAEGGEALIRSKSSDTFEPVPNLREVGSRIQYVFQDPYSSLNPILTIGKILREPLENNKELSTKQRTEIIHEMLQTVGLEPFHATRYPGEFSGGQRQRIAIARALLMNPEIIICDEVVSALDVSVQAKVLNLLNELKYENKLSYLFISHDLDVVRHMCDRVLVMNEGRIVEEALSDQLFEKPKTEYTKELLA